MSGQAFRRLTGRLALQSAVLFARQKFNGKLKYPDFMLGFSTSGCYSEVFFLKDIARLKNGQIAEAIFHPGPENIDIREFNTWGYKWAIDSATLRSEHVKKVISELGIRLVTFGQFANG